MALAIALILLVVGSVLFHVLSPWWFTPIASNWGAIDTTLVMTIAITGFVFVVVNLFMAYAVIRYRRREGQTAAYEPENKKLEWWLTGFTTVGVVAMLAPGLVVWAQFVTVPDDAAVFEAVGQQWKWSYRFPGKDGELGTVDVKHISFRNPFGMNPDDPKGQDDLLVAGSEVHIAVDQPVKVLLRSKDVLHDFYVPQFRAKMDLVPGMVTYFWFTPTRTGTFEVLCAELCGIGHHTMRGHVVVDEEKDFQAWLQTQPTFAQTQEVAKPGPGNELIAQGLLLAEDQGCLACHSLDGSESVGPTWKGMYGKTETLADGTTVVVDDDYLRESIADPNAKIVQGFEPLMPPYEFSDAEMAALIALTKDGAEGADGGAGLAGEGRRLAEDQGCLACHSLDGSESVGPTWKGMYGKTETLADGATAVVDDDYLKESIVAPNAKVVRGYEPLMPPYELSDAELEALIAFAKAVSE